MYLGSACVVRNVLITVMLHCASILRLREGGLGLNDNYPATVWRARLVHRD